MILRTIVTLPGQRRGRSHAIGISFQIWHQWSLRRAKDLIRLTSSPGSLVAELPTREFGRSDKQGQAHLHWHIGSSARPLANVLDWKTLWYIASLSKYGIIEMQDPERKHSHP